VKSCCTTRRRRRWRHAADAGAVTAGDVQLSVHWVTRWDAFRRVIEHDLMQIDLRTSLSPLHCSIICLSWKSFTLLSILYVNRIIS